MIPVDRPRRRGPHGPPGGGTGRRPRRTAASPPWSPSRAAAGRPARSTRRLPLTPRTRLAAVHPGRRRHRRFLAGGGARGPAGRRRTSWMRALVIGTTGFTDRPARAAAAPTPTRHAGGPRRQLQRRRPGAADGAAAAGADPARGLRRRAGRDAPHAPSATGPAARRAGWPGPGSAARGGEPGADAFAADRRRDRRAHLDHQRPGGDPAC